jgi:hypothetical protein
MPNALLSSPPKPLRKLTLSYAKATEDFPLVHRAIKV